MSDSRANAASKLARQEALYQAERLRVAEALHFFFSEGEETWQELDDDARDLFLGAADAAEDALFIRRSRVAVLDEAAAAFEEWFAPRDTPVYGELDPGPDYVLKNTTPLARLEDVLGVLNHVGRFEDAA